MEARPDVTTILSNGIVITCDRFNTCGRYHVAVTDGRIVSCSRDLSELTSLHSEASIVDASEKFILPGFVNPHLHCESLLHGSYIRGQHMRLWPSDASLNEASEKVRTTPTDLRTLYRYASLLLVRNGITTAAEYTVASDEEGFRVISDALQVAGVKPVLSLPNWEAASALRLMGSSRPMAFVDLGREQDYTMYRFQSLANLARDEGLPMLIHIAETREDGEGIRKNFSRTPLTTLEEYGVLQPGSLIVHANHLPPPDIEILQRLRIPVAVCPQSTAYKQTGYPALRALMNGEVTIGIGTDWGQPDMLRALRFASDLPFLIRGFPHRSPSDLLRMVTLHAAHCLGTAQDTGSIEPGKKADLTILDPGRAIILPDVDNADAVISALVHEYASARVSDVMIDGDWCLKDYHPLTLDEEVTEAAMADLVARYYPESSLQRPLVVSDAQPFAKPTGDEDEGFEEGFSVVGPAPVGPLPRPEPQPAGGQSASPEKKPGRPPQQPELSKNVRRVFGEDDA